MVRDPYGAKMSKTPRQRRRSAGVINDFGADALRFALIQRLSPGVDQRLGTSRLEGARNFANKIWNAARFVVNARPPEVAGDAALQPPALDQLGPAEHWILERCRRTIEAVDRAYEEFQLGEVARLLYDAIWSEYCDWYLEIAKLGLAGDDGVRQGRAATWRTLAWVLDRYLRLLHPVMPHVTEEIWSRLAHGADGSDLLIVADWPQPGEGPEPDAGLAAGVADLIELVGAVRAARAESGIEAATWLPALVWLPDGSARAAFAALEAALGRLARVKPELVDDRAALDERGRSGLTVVTTAGEARLIRSDADRAREHARLEKELRNIETQLTATEARLSDDAFRSRAPQRVVEQSEARAAELREQLAALKARMEDA
jgi:valyl-tRNA synthetase